MADDSDFRGLVGRRIASKIELIQVLGYGGMGAVFRAHHEGLDRQIAIKVLRRASTELADRFRVEAKASSRLDHPNTVRVLDFGEDGPDGLLYIAMEYIEGETLLQVIKREVRLPAGRAIGIMRQVLSALSEAHDKRVVHRDLKPGNIMLTKRYAEHGQVEDFVKVCDFGLAKLVDPEPDEALELTKQGALLGTPAYMSPEQIQHGPIDGRSDLYACGNILYRVLSGEPAIRGMTAFETAMRQLAIKPDHISKHCPQLEAHVAEAVMRALEKDPEKRFPSARAMAEALDPSAAWITSVGPPIESPSFEDPEGATENVPRALVPISAASALVPLEATASPLIQENTRTLNSGELSPPPGHGAAVYVLAFASIVVAALLAFVLAGGLSREAPAPLIAQAPAPTPEPTLLPRATTWIELPVEAMPGTTVTTSMGLYLGEVKRTLRLERDKPIALVFHLHGYKDRKVVVEPWRTEVIRVAFEAVDRPASARPRPTSKPDLPAFPSQ